VGEQDGREETIWLRTVADAGQELLDLVDDSIHVAGRWEVVDTVQLDVLRAGNVLGEVTRGLHGDRALAGVVEDEGRHPDHRQHIPDVDVGDDAPDGPRRTRARRLAHEARPPVAEALQKNSTFETQPGTNTRSRGPSPKT
jgi:hypothetical protein